MRVHRVPIEFVTWAAEPERAGRFRPGRRSLVAVAAITLGFLIAREVSGLHPVTWFVVCQTALVLVLLTGGVWCRLLLFLAAVAFAGGWFSLRIHEQLTRTSTDILVPLGLESDTNRTDGIGRIGGYSLVEATGIVLEPPQPTEPLRGELARFFHSSPSVRFTLAASTLKGPGGTAHRGGVVVVFITMPEKKEGGGSPMSLDLHAGDTATITGQFSLIRPPMNPGEADKRLYAAQDGIIGQLDVPEASLVLVAGAPTRPTTLAARAVSIASRVQASMRSRARAALTTALPIPRGPHDTARDSSGRALLIAMLLGQRERGYEQADQAFRRLGLVHLVAISGFNLAILAGMVLFLVRLTGDHGRIEPLIVAGVVIAYMLVVPAEAPVLRSGVTVLLFLAAEASGRRYDRLGMLGWVAALLLLWRPMDLWSLGFQLSFGIVAALLWLGRRTEAMLFGVPLRGVVRPTRTGPAGLLARTSDLLMPALRPLLSSSVLAWAVALPTVASHTGNVSPFAVLTTIIVLPLSIIVLWAGYLVLAIGVILPDAGAWTGGVLGWLGDVLVGTVFGLDDLPAMALGVPSISAWWSAAATVVLLAWFRLGHSRVRLLRRAPLAAAPLLIAWLALEVYANTRLRSDTMLRIDTLSVGDGTCHLVRSADEAMLWDCGSSMSGFGVRNLPRAVRELGAWRVRTVVITHANLDHFSALLDAAGVLGVRRVLICQAFKADADALPRSADAALLRGLAERGIEVRVIAAGDVLTLGEADLSFLSPPVGVTFSESNDTSLIGLCSVPTPIGASHALFTGDTGVAAIRSLRSRYPSLHADIMELPHHGSFNHESAALVVAVNPGIVLQSTGPRRVGDPRWDIAREGRTWLTTGGGASGGAAWVEIRRDGSTRHGERADHR
jgi:competence protein ComEC